MQEYFSLSGKQRQTFTHWLLVLLNNDFFSIQSTYTNLVTETKFGYCQIKRVVVNVAGISVNLD